MACKPQIIWPVVVAAVVLGLVQIVCTLILVVARK